MNSDFNTSMNDFFKVNIATVYTSMPCRIIRVQSTDTMLVDVQPLVNMVYPDGTDELRPTLLGIPVQMPASGTSAVNIPLKAEDIVLCVFSMRGLDAFKSGDGTPTAPTDFRMLDKRDAIAIPGIFPTSLHPNQKRILPFNPDALSLTQDIGLPTESTVELSTTGIKLMQGPSSIVVNPAGVDITGLLTINGVPFPLHTHSGVTPGGGVSGPVVI